MSDVTANAAIAGAVILSGISLLLLAIGVISYTRLRHGRLLWICIAFLVMAVQGAVLTFLTYGDRGAIADGDLSLPGLTAVNLGIVLALYFAVLKR